MAEPLERRKLLMGIGTCIMGSIAGCGGGNNAGDDGGDGGNTTDNGSTNGGDGNSDEIATATPTSTPTAVEELSWDASTSIDSIEIENLARTEIGADDRFSVVVSVRNTGSTPFVPSDYFFDLTVYDVEGNNITGNDGGWFSPTGAIAPGEVGDVVVEAGVSGSFDDVARVEVTISEFQS